MKKQKDNNPVTTSYLDERFDQFDLQMDMKFQTWGNVLREEMKEGFTEMNDKMMTGFDKVMLRLDDIDANITIQGNDVDELKVRVTALEHRKN